MMIHSLAARALLMMADFGCGSVDAVLWVCRNLPPTLRGYYHRSLIQIVAVELCPEGK